jgi:small subunit ribosomal protein S3
VWYAGAHFADLLHEDLRLRDYIKKRLYKTGIAKVDIERAGRKAKIHIYTARPGLVIGKRGEDVDKLRLELERLTGRELLINIHEVMTPELSAQLVAESISTQLERRVSFRRAMKKTMQNTMRLGAKGIRLRVAGRLNGAEIARVENSRDGSVPLHTLRADVDYGVATAFTTYGTIGVKCWLYLGDVTPGEQKMGLPGGGAATAGRRERPGGGRERGGGGGRERAGNRS